MKLDISTIPVEEVRLAWLTPLCTVNKFDQIIISKEQKQYIFTNWGYYRDIRVTVKP